MAPPTAIGATLDAATAALVRLSASVAVGAEGEVRDALDRCAAAGTPGRWVEELILQSYLFVGLPRALNAAREWRRGQGGAEPGAGESSYVDMEALRQRGEATCAVVYGAMYDKLRHNIRTLHPAFDEWMIVEGYGKVLAREGLDLGRRELCIVAACAATMQERQLHSHLHGALNAGAPPGALDGTLVAIAPDIDGRAHADAVRLWNRVRGH